MFRANLPRVYGLVLDRCGSPSVAEESTSQTFESAARHAAAGRVDEISTPWLFVVAKRRLVDYWRRETRWSSVRDRLGTTADEVVTSPDSEDPRVSAALDSLSSRQRLVLTLRYIDEWSVAEIAEGLDMGYRAAESLLARARRSFRRAYDEEVDGG